MSTLIRRVCAWCGAILGEAQAERGGDTPLITHGLCAPCAGESGMVPVENLFSLSPGELDTLPFGVIEIDQAGTILAYNEAERTLSGNEPSEVVGRNFFTSVAPCTAVQRFAGVYRDMVARGKSDHTTFNYLFRFSGGSAFVHVALTYEAARGRGLILVKRLS